MQFFIDNKEIISGIIGALFAVATIITGLTNTPIDDTVVSVLRRIVAAFGFAQFKDAPGSIKAPLVPAENKPLFSDRK